MLSWLNPADDSITGYQVLRGPDADSLVVIEQDTGSSGTSYTDTAPPAGRTHTYTVKARNATGLSPLSNTVTATVPAAETEEEEELVTAQQSSGATLTDEPAGEDFPGASSNAHETPGLVTPGTVSAGHLTAGLDRNHGHTGDYWYLDTEASHSYRVEVKFGANPGISTRDRPGSSFSIQTASIMRPAAASPITIATTAPPSSTSPTPTSPGKRTVTTWSRWRLLICITGVRRSTTGLRHHADRHHRRQADG